MKNEAQKLYNEKITKAIDEGDDEHIEDSALMLTDESEDSLDDEEEAYDHAQSILLQEDNNNHNIMRIIY